MYVLIGLSVTRSRRISLTEKGQSAKRQATVAVAMIVKNEMFIFKFVIIIKLILLFVTRSRRISLIEKGQSVKRVRQATVAVAMSVKNEMFIFKFIIRINQVGLQIYNISKTQII